MRVAGSGAFNFIRFLASVFRLRLNVDGVQPLGTLDDVELNRLPGLERFIAVHMDG